MPAPQSVLQAVQAAILASAHLTAFEHVAAAAQACQRLGSMTSGRFRSAARDLTALEEDLQTALTATAETLVEQAESLGLEEDTLWTVGDAAATLDMLREDALDEVDEGSPAARLLQGHILFGASFVEDDDLPDRGTTLLFGWPEPLQPATWPWQANWISDSDEATEELDLFEVGDMAGEDSLLAELADELGCSRQDAREALREAALALTRASLLAGAGNSDDDEDEEDSDNGSA
jgi:hypothetical protein